MVKDGWGRTLRLVGLAVGALALLLAAYQLSSVFNPLLIAMLLTYISDPVIGRLEKVFRHRLVAILFIYLYLGVLFVAVPVLLVGKFYAESRVFFVTLAGESSTDLNGNGLWDPGERFVDQNGDRVAQPEELFSDTNGNGKWEHFEDGPLYSLLDRARTYERGLDEQTRSYLAQAVDLDAAIAYLKANLKQIGVVVGQAGGWLLDTVVTSIQGAFDYLSYLVLVPVYTFFLLYEWSSIKKTVADYLPGRYRSRTLDLVGKIDKAVSAFFRGRLIICFIKGALTALGLWICGVRFAFFVGMAAGFLSIVPFLGVISGVVPSLIFVVIDYQGALLRLIGLAVVFGAVEAIEGVLLTPWILGKETGLHPVTLILAILIFGKLLGLFGLLMAVPLIAIVKILSKEFLLPHLEELAKERSGGGR